LCRRVAISRQFWYRAARKSWTAAVAQPVEQRIRNAWVGGSNPLRGTIAQSPAVFCPAARHGVGNGIRVRISSLNPLRSSQTENESKSVRYMARWCPSRRARRGNSRAALAQRAKAARRPGSGRPCRARFREMMFGSTLSGPRLAFDSSHHSIKGAWRNLAPRSRLRNSRSVERRSKRSAPPRRAVEPPLHC
jgi:hypothetical protein